MSLGKALKVNAIYARTHERMGWMGQVQTEAGQSKVRWKELASAQHTAVGALTWLKARFDAPLDWSSPEALAIDLTGATKGHVFLNGFDAGGHFGRQH